MAVVRCPNCGKPNPDFLEVCQYCETSLHGAPADLNATPPAAPPAAGSAADDTLLPAAPAGGAPEVPLAVHEAAEPPTPAAEPESESEPVGWLERLRVKHAGEGEPAARTGPAVEPDWMWTGQLGDQAPAAPAAPQTDARLSAPDASAQLPVWLRGLDLDDEPSAPNIAAAPPAGTRPFAAPKPGEPQAASHSSAVPPAAPPAGLPTGAVEIRPVSPEPAGSNMSSGTPATEDIISPRPRPKMIDRLKGLGSAPPAAPEPPPAASGPASAPPTTSRRASSPPAPNAGVDLPDWLTALTGATPPAARSVEPPKPAEPPPPAAPEERSLPVTEAVGPVLAEPGASEQPAGTAAADEALPPRPRRKMSDWLGALQSVPPAAPPATPAPPAVPNTYADLPPWLKAIGTTPAASGQSSATPAAIPPAASAPRPTSPSDTGGPPTTAQPSTASQAAAPQGMASLPAVPNPENELPAWLKALRAQSAVPTTPAPGTAAPPSTIGPATGMLAVDRRIQELPEAMRSQDAALADTTRSSSVIPQTATPASAAPSSPSAPPPALPDDMPQWLRGILAAQAPPAAAETSAAPLGARTPQASPAPETPKQTAAPASASEAPAADDTLVPSQRRARRMSDWLGNTPVPPAAPTPAGDDLPEWLRNISLPQPPAEPSEPAAKIELPDWLSTIAPAATAPATTAAAAPPAADTGAPPTAPAERLPDWITSIPATAATPAHATEAVAQAAADTGAPPAAQAEELPDWIKSIAPSAVTPAQATGAAAPEATQPPAPADEALPDWLKTIAQDSRKAAATATASTATTPAEPAEPWSVPTDWAPTGAASIEQAPHETVPAAVHDEDVSDWLKSLPESPDSTTAQTAPAQPPEWLQGLGTGEPPDIHPETLAGLGTSQAEGADEATQSAEPAADIDAAGSKGPAVAEGPAWLGELASLTPAAGGPAAGVATSGGVAAGDVTVGAAAAGAVPAGSVAQPEIAQTSEEDLPDWLRSMRSAAALGGTAPTEMPDWVRAPRGLPPRTKAPGTAPSAADTTLFPVGGTPPSTAAAADIEQAALPAWLAAMRPVDIQRPEASGADSYQDTLGVLAGMRGVLRAEPAVAQPHKATTPVQRLEVSDTHTARANLLVELQHDQATLLPARRDQVRLSAMLERWVVFAILATAILLAQFRFANLFPLPAPGTADIQPAFAIVNGLATGKPALVAFDYEAAQQGELNPGALALVGHLLRRGVRVVAVSTRLTGAAAGQELLDQSAALAKAPAGPAGYGSLYLNLGYIPGGPVGLLQFAAAPRSLFTNDFTHVFTSTSVWDAAPLATVQKLSDFGLIVLVSGTPESTRMWIEQAQSFAPAVPMLAVVSASAEPLVRPYLDTAGAPQGAALRGLVVGVAGAAQYEQLAGTPGAGAALWPALGGGLLAAALLIASGNLVFGLLGLVRGQRGGQRRGQRRPKA